MIAPGVSGLILSASSERGERVFKTADSSGEGEKY